MPLLSATPLSFAYPGPIPALERVQLSLEAGELVAVIGPNGSGKSTLVKLLAGLLQPAQGEVHVGGLLLRELDPRERARRVAFVPQFLAALPELRVERFVLGGRYARLDLWRRAASRDFEVVREALARSQAEDLSGRLLTELSGGQLQRVLIARALAQEAHVVLVDEPTNALDPEHQVRTFALLEGLVRTGCAVVVVTHELNLASQFATRVLLLQTGRAVASGSVHEVLQPQVLEPIYGRDLAFGTLATPSGERPFVLPWRRSEA